MSKHCYEIIFSTKSNYSRVEDQKAIFNGDNKYKAIDALIDAIRKNREECEPGLEIASIKSIKQIY